MNFSSEIGLEHKKIKKLLTEIESFIINEKLEYFELSNRLTQLNNLWDIHEKKEEVFFKSMNKKKNSFPTPIMFMKEHKELKGHWKVLQEAINSGDQQEIMISLETDGRMLFDKFRKHMEAEEEFFSQLEIKSMPAY